MSDPNYPPMGNPMYDKPETQTAQDPLIASQPPDPQIAAQGPPPMPNQYVQPVTPPAAMPQMPNQYGQQPVMAPMPNQYGQPATAPPGSVPMPNAIVINQQSPAVMINPEVFKLNPVTINCPSCGKTITTVVTQNFSCLACLLCCCTSLICYLIIQTCRGKDLCCQDADHTCPYCGRLIASYKAC